MSRYFQNKKIVVTGAGGFTGSHICEALIEAGASVIAVVRKKSKIISLKEISDKITIKEIDLTNKKQLKKLLHNVDLVIHAAAVDGGTSFKRNHASKIFHDNVHMTMNVFESLKNSSVEKIIFISSAEVYSNLKNKNNIKEENFLLSHPLKPEQWYAFSKMIGEYTAQLIGNALGIKVIIIRPANIYGPRDSSKKGRLVPTLLHAIKKRKKKVKLTGTGKDIRSFLYVTDYTDNILQLLEHSEGGIYNIAGSHAISIEDFTKIFSRYSKTTFMFRDPYDSNKKNFSKFILNIEKIKKTIPLWYDANYNERIKKLIEMI